MLPSTNRHLRVINNVVITFAFLLMVQPLKSQSFLKSYNYPLDASRPVTFECMTPTVNANGNFHVAGHIGDSVAVFEIDQNGGVLQTIMIKNVNPGSRLDGIVYDGVGNVIVIGNYETPTFVQGFVFKLSGNIVQWFRVMNTPYPITFLDIDRIEPSNNFRIGGTRGLSTYNYAIIFDLNGATGNLALFKEYRILGTEDAAAIQNANNLVYGTSRYAIAASITKWRVGLSIFSNGAIHQSSKYYMLKKAKLARMYSSDMLMDVNDGVICGWGDDNGTLLFENLSLTKVQSDGDMIWSRKYDDLTNTMDGTLNAIRYDNGLNNYVMLGYQYTAGSLDNAFMIYTDSSGNVLWSHEYAFYRKPTLFSENHQGVLATVGGFVYAIGQRTNAFGKEEGTLLKVSSADGLLLSVDGTTCSTPIVFQVTNYNYSSPVTPNISHPTITTSSFISNSDIAPISSYRVCGADTCSISGSIDVGEFLICSNDTTQLFANGYAGVAPYTYNWSPAIYTSCSTCPNTDAFPPVSTTYTVTITDAIGCTYTNSVYLQVDTTCCDTCAVPTALSNGCGVGILCGSNTLNWTTDTCAQSVNISYTNITAGTPTVYVPGLTGNSFNVSLPAGNLIQWQIQSNCKINKTSPWSLMQSFTAINCAAFCKLESTENSSHITLHPNPTNDILYLEGALENDVVRIYDAIGHQITALVISNYNQELTVSNWPNGIYFVTVLRDGLLTTSQFVKQ